MSSPLVKAVALFMDGTTNSKRGFVEAGAEVDALTMAGWTNVAILSEWIPDSVPPGNADRYIPGVGSDEVPAGFHPQLVARNMFGKYFGGGLTGKVREGYERLCRHHRAGYNLYLFGFSRGACAARVLAGFVDEVGLLFEEQLDRVDDAWNIYIRCGDVDASDLRAYLRDVCDTDERPSQETATNCQSTFLASGTPSRCGSPLMARSTIQHPDSHVCHRT